MITVNRDELQAAILSTATSVPKFSVDNPTSAQLAAHTLCVGNSHTRKVKALYRRSGIQRRGSVLLEEPLESEVVGQAVEHEFYPPAVSDEDRGPTTKSRNDRYASEAPQLAENAASEALRISGLTSDEITHLVTVSCTGFNAPGIDVALIQRLGLPATTQRVQVGFMGCHALINGLRAASGLVSSLQSNVLLCSVELCSLHMQYGTNADRIVSNSLFADGAGAMVLQSSRLSDGADRIVATGSYLIPNSTDAMTWCIGDNGFEMTLSARVPHLIEENLAAFIGSWLAEQGESIKSVGGWAVHPGGPRILMAVETSLGLREDALEVPRSILAQYGNMSSATMAFILERFAARKQPKPWLMMGFGPGLEIEVALVR